nr:hypothetical protein [Candidatus Freyarchaeota archaeon]
TPRSSAKRVKNRQRETSASTRTPRVVSTPSLFAASPTAQGSSYSGTATRPETGMSTLPFLIQGARSRQATPA